MLKNLRKQQPQPNPIGDMEQFYLNQYFNNQSGQHLNNGQFQTNFGPTQSISQQKPLHQPHFGGTQTQSPNMVVPDALHLQIIEERLTYIEQQLSSIKYNIKKSYFR